MTPGVFRIERILVNVGLCSRSNVRKYVVKNRVMMKDGNRVKGSDLSKRIKPIDISGVFKKGNKDNIDSTESVLPFGDAFDFGTDFGRFSIGFNKPQGFVCSFDEKNRNKKGDVVRLVHDLLPIEMKRMIPSLSFCGRLDKISTGLLILSQDPLIRKAITAPSHSPPKHYILTLKHPIKNEGSKERELFESGMLILRGEDKPLNPCRMEYIDENTVELVLRQGKYHQCRRMFAAVGNRVVDIKRTSIGPISVHGIPEGKWRKLTNDEVSSLINHNKTERNN